ncbi:MAG: class II fructose-bisphosphatase [Verrucomicrobiota bacterium]|nr:class II fructose-bisphosphatase [Verrucomicrobiota bacterium]
MKTPREQYYDVERIIEYDFVRATEAAALNAIQWLGRGEKEKADAAACDAIRGMFDLMNICGEVVIGEGIKDNAPGIFKGENLGTWTPGTLKFDLALDPIDGTTNISKGAPNSISCIAAASPEAGVQYSLKDVPSFYMMKLAYGPQVVSYMERSGIETIQVQNPIEETLVAISKALRKRVQDVVVLVMDRPRHDQLITEVRKVGAALRMVGDGDIAAAISPSIRDSGVDLYVGVGGSPEAVLSAAALKCLGGDIQCMMWPRDDAEKKQLIDDGYGEELKKVFYADDLAHGQNIIFCATGISDSPLMKGVLVREHTAITHSILMRAKSRTLRHITAYHDLRQKTIRLRSDNREHRL